MCDRADGMCDECAGSDQPAHGCRAQTHGCRRPASWITRIDARLSTTCVRVRLLGPRALSDSFQDNKDLRAGCRRLASGMARAWAVMRSTHAPIAATD